MGVERWNLIVLICVDMLVLLRFGFSLKHVKKIYSNVFPFGSLQLLCDECFRLVCLTCARSQLGAQEQEAKLALEIAALQASFTSASSMGKGGAEKGSLGASPGNSGAYAPRRWGRGLLQMPPRQVPWNQASPAKEGIELANALAGVLKQAESNQRGEPDSRITHQVSKLAELVGVSF